ncbi:hypothetical protein FRC06_006370 [Ceratobasidium sp. 370]|nr:hypothetical protein FRC06_006370 [Ceratobasidium sp. 370]
MLLSFAVTAGLLATGVFADPPGDLCTGSRVIDDPDEYLAYAKACGMCRPKKFGLTENLNRALVIPGSEVLANFSNCVAKNEFHEELQDRSGSIFCSGKTIHLMADAMNHNDSKTFVDRASTLDGRHFNEKIEHFFGEGLANQFTVEQFLKHINEESGMREAGGELQHYNNSRFPNTPHFIAQIRPKARLLQAWSKIVHHYWNNLDRTMIQRHNNLLIPGPGSDPDEDPTEGTYSTTLIRLEHPFVIAGGRFREQYYWDSFFIMEGLLAANMGYLARTTLLNFMDQIKAYGFIPNGGRKYYLNRSQPPLFINMLHTYVEHTNDFQILHEALPLAERELQWWYKNRTVLVFHDGTNHTVFRYNVKATGPRPESYAEDWRSVWCYSEHAPDKPTQEFKYSEFASGAESGWDYTARWMSDPFNVGQHEVPKQMTYLRIRDIIPVDLNSMLYRCHKLMALMYQEASNNESPYAIEYVERHEKKAEALRKAILALHWDPENLAFFDFVLERDECVDCFKGGPKDCPEGRKYCPRGEIQRFWSGASLVPYWAEIWPDNLRCELEPEQENDDEQEKKRKRKQKAQRQKNLMKAFSGVRDLLQMYPGPLPATLVETGQQWDFPNSWPPLQYFAIKALQNINETCVDGTKTADFHATTRPKEHLGKVDPPGAILNTPSINYKTSPSWRDVLVKTVAMRYMNAAFCTWNNEGQLPDDRVEILMRDNAVNDKNLYKHPGNMFEKLKATSPVDAGGGGEYDVQTGFGWTNGVAIWIARQFGAILDNPDCTRPSPCASSIGQAANETLATCQAVDESLVIQV